MEESEKRRERLKAMRMEAAQVGVQGEDGYSADASYSLTNPLVQASAAPPVHAEPNVARRFDYYTDPMSAFSANKSRSKVSHQISPDSFMPPRPRDVGINSANQTQTSYAPDQRIFPGPGSYRSSSPSGSPMRSPSTFGTPPQGNMNVGCGTYGFPSNLSGGNFPRADFVQRGSPSIDYGKSRGYGFNNNPQTGSGNWGRPYPHSGRGRSQWLAGNSPQTGPGNWGRPHHHSGRGRSYWRGGNNPGPMQSGRTVGSRDNVSAELRPDLYYDKSMVEDPWEMLKPVIWRKGALTGSDTPDSAEPWLPKSINSKKARVSETSIKYNSGKSLAEDLAASFHAAANYEPHDDSPKDNF